MRSEPLQLITEFVLDHAQDAPVRKRIAIYRALAECCGSPQEAVELRTVADNLESAEHACRQFVFRIKLNQ